jgi:hypothetical protein
MNKHSVKKKRPAKAGTKTSRSAAPRKAPSRAVAAVRKPSATRQSARKPESTRQSARKPESLSAARVATATVEVATVTVAQVAALAPGLKTHKYRVGQTVFYTSSPISRPGASGSYQVVRLLPSDGDDYQYRIKNPGEAFERVAKESQLELEH